MAVRIMPGKPKDDIEESSYFFGIDPDKVAEGLGLMKKTAKTEEVEADCGTCAEDEKEEKEASPKKKPLPWDDDYVKKGEKCKECDKETCECEVEETKEVEASSQIKMPTAAYLEKALARGDKKAYKEALMQRSAARAQLMKIAESLPEEEDNSEQVAKREQIIAAVAAREKREAARKEILARVERETLVKQSTAKATPKATPKVAAKAAPKVVKADTFKKASEIDGLDKIVLANRLKSIGMDDSVVNNYVKYVCSSKKEDTYEMPEMVTTLAEMKAPKSQKTAAFKAWYRTAKLEAEDASRVRNYWADELGYQDKEWCSDLVEDVDPVKGA